MKRKPKTKLTEQQWSHVFVLRCRSKRGEKLHQDDHDLCSAAMEEDVERYRDLDIDVFNATVPPGSTRHIRKPRKVK